MLVLGLGQGAGFEGDRDQLTRIASDSASKVTVFLYLQPVGACVIAYFWLGEIPAWLTVLGGSLAVGGVVLATAPGLRMPAWRRRLTPQPEA